MANSEKLDEVELVESVERTWGGQLGGLDGSRDTGWCRSVIVNEVGREEDSQVTIGVDAGLELDSKSVLDVLESSGGSRTVADWY